MYRRDRANRAGGVALLIRNDIKHYQLLLPTTVNLEVVGIKILLDNSEIRVISAYKRPSRRLIEDELIPLLDDNINRRLGGDMELQKNQLLEFASNNGLMIAAPNEVLHSTFWTLFLFKMFPLL